MNRKTIEQIEREVSQEKIPTSAVREYITDMLAELCVVARHGGHEDLHILLKLTHQAARNAG